MSIAVAATSRSSAVAAVVSAFASDPILRWVYPDPARYLAAFPAVVDAFGAGAFDAGTAEISPGGEGAAIWLGPGTEPDQDAVAAHLAATVDADRHDQVFGLLEQIDEHHPKREVWYLPFIGVDPPHQGRGLGSVLLASGLERADRDGIEAYLEASTPANRRLYERHGFDLVGELRSGDSPPLWPMLRPPANAPSRERSDR